MLTEAQIQRYSRQILLTGVGGHGQEALLSQPFVLRGRGAGLETAAAYLAAAGCPLELQASRDVEAGEVGFLWDHASVGKPQPKAPTGSVGVPEAGSSAAGAGPTRVPGELGEVPTTFVGAGPRVALGRWASSEGEEGVAWAASHTCTACFSLAVGLLSGGVEGAGSVRAGSVAALVAQHLILGLEKGVGVLRLSPRGSLREEVPRCPRCR